MTLPHRMRKPRAEPPWVECPECGQGLYSEWVDFGSGLMNADGSDATSWHLATSCCGAPLDELERTLR